MNNRKHIYNPKTVVACTEWKKGNIPKKNAPFFGAVFPLADIWNWREAVLDGENGESYHLLVMYRADSKLNYKAWLSTKIIEKDYANSIVMNLTATTVAGIAIFFAVTNTIL